MNQKKNLNVNRKIALLKKNCMRLRANYQLPNELCVEIIRLGYNDNVKYVKHLMDLCEHYLRVAGYYKKYPQLHAETNKIISEDLKQFKISID